MSVTDEDMSNMSQKLSEVMDDIGVNKRIVQKRRRAYKIIEAILNIVEVFSRYVTGNYEIINYIMGSQSEGSTTFGLNSDNDILKCHIEYNLIQDLSECQEGKVNFLMIQNRDIPPGYCHLQFICGDRPVNATCPHYFSIYNEKLLLMNTFPFSSMILDSDIWQENGPAITTTQHAVIDIDFVFGFYCKSLPREIKIWILKQRKCDWPTQDVLVNCSREGCLVVGVGSKVSDRSELEWRISTHLQERYIMLSLNITQLSCYILMKMFLKTHINPHVEKVLSSYMCKNVLWYCISESTDHWHSGNLLSYLHICLSRLRKCVKLRNCPHFIIPENNLLCERMTEIQQSNILEIMDNLSEKTEKLLFEITIDDLGRRLKIKLNKISQCSDIPTPTQICQKISSELVKITADSMYLGPGHTGNLYRRSHNLLSSLLRLKADIERYSASDDLKPFSNTDVESLHVACKLLMPKVLSELGSILASHYIASDRAISEKSFKYLKAGKSSDVLSGRLYLLSAIYCTGDMERAEQELDNILKHYEESSVTHFCHHKPRINANAHKDFVRACENNNENAIKTHMGICLEFGQSEIHCVPHELRYELLRTFTEKDRQMRTKYEVPFVGNIAVDSVPYLHFLQYKIYGRLQQRKEQQEALEMLANCSLDLVDTGQMFGHFETYWKLFGQCFEQENDNELAFVCYIKSLRVHRNNNAARFLLCLQLFKLLKQNNLI